MLLGILSAALCPAQAAPLQSGAMQAQVRLGGHVPLAAVAQARVLGRSARSETVSLALTLPLRDPAGAQRLIARLYDPAAPEYGHYLTPAQFTERFGPTQQTYDAVAAFARSKGLTVTATHPNRVLLDVSGPAPTVETAFGVHLMRYQAHDGRVFRAPDANPLIPASLAGRLSGVIGLDTAAVARPHFHRRQPNAKSGFQGMQPRLMSPSQAPQDGTGPQGGLTPGDVKTAYNLNSVTQSGAGQTLGLFELDGYDPADITAYENAYALPNVPLQNIFVDGYDGSAGQNAGEVTLDIELMTALAPSVKSILVYESANTGPAAIDQYSRIASDNTAKVISSSWGLPELGQDSASRDAENTIFQQMAAQGQSIYAAAGDNGAYDDGVSVSVDDPASQPFMTGVGGTKLFTSSPGGPYQAEQAWGDPTEQSNDPADTHGAGGGGGISAVWPIPDYQVGVGLSTTQRNVPDVSLDADPNTGYSIYFEGGFTVFGGTSCAAPLWAAFTALVNQDRASLGQPTLGFANPTLYKLGTSQAYGTSFHDIADGTTNLYYKATAGYDNATGFGSFNGAGLLSQLASPTNGTVSPIASLTLKPAIVVGGLKSAGTVVLTNPAPTGGAVVTLTTSDPTTTTVPVTVTVLAGGTTATFSISTVAVTGVKQAIITATYNSGSLAATLTVTPDPGTIAPQSLSFDIASVCGGDPATATLNLNGPAPIGGLVAQVSSDTPSAAVPVTVTVPEGTTSTTFSIATSQVAVVTVATISVSANNVTKTAALTVQSPVLEPFTINPGQITGGRQAAAALSLTCPAPPAGATVTLSSDHPAIVILPPSVTFPASSTLTSFPISTVAVSSPVDVTLTATYAGVVKTTQLTVQPGGLVGLTVLPATVTGGAVAVGTLNLDSNAPPGGLVVTLSSSDPSAVVPATVTVPAGASTVTFLVTTIGVATSVTDTITARLNGAVQTETLTILPVRATSLVLNPTRIVSGGASTGNVTINAPAPAGGLAVTLTTDSPTLVTLPAAVVVPAGQTSTAFTITGVKAGNAGITATLGGQSATATLTVASAPGTSYPTGLNFISVPYDYSGLSLDSIFGYTGVKLAVWLPAQSQYALTPNSPADALRPGRGYWVNLPHALTLTTVGVSTNKTQDFSIALSPGWNQVGNPFTVPIKLGITRAANGSVQVPFAEAASAVPLLLSSLVYSYQPAASGATGSYVWTRDTDFLQPGQGYWVYAYQAVTLTIPHPAQ